MNNDSELRQYLLDQEEQSRTRQQVAWAILRDRLYEDQVPHWAHGLWRNLALGTLAVVALVAAANQFLPKTPSPTALTHTSNIVNVTLQPRPIQPERFVESYEPHVLFVSQEQPEVTTTTFYSTEAQADVIWVANAGYVQE
jgi:hypothetical protein